MSARQADAKALRERAKRTLLRVQNQALNAIAGMYKQPGEEGYNPDAETPWKDASTRTRGSFVLAQSFVSEERVRAASEAPRTLGVVVVTDRIANPADWERLASQVNHGVAIEAMEVPCALPREDIQREPGGHGGIPVELATHLREEGDQSEGPEADPRASKEG